MLPVDQLGGLAGIPQGSRWEFLGDLKTRQMSYPIHPLCRACASDCKVHDAKGLIVFVCHAFKKPNHR